MKLKVLLTLLISLGLGSCSSIERAPRSQKLEQALYLSSEGELDAAVELFEQACDQGLKGGCLAIGKEVELLPVKNLQVHQFESSDRSTTIQYLSSASEELRAFIWDQDELRLMNEAWINRLPVDGGVELSLTGLRPGKTYRLDLYAAEGSFVSSHFFKALATEGVELRLALGTRPQEVFLTFDTPSIWQRELTPIFLHSRLLGSEALHRVRLRGLDYYFLDMKEGLTLKQKNTLLDLMAKSRRGAILVSKNPIADSQLRREFFRAITLQVRAPVLFIHGGELTELRPISISGRESYEISIGANQGHSQLSLQTTLGVIKGSLNNKEFEVEVK